MNTPQVQPSESNHESVRASVRETRDAAVLLGESASNSARATAAAMHNQLQTRPYLTLGIAAGVGFVVAGGLASPALRGLVRVGGRFAFAALTSKLWEIYVEPKT